eukprot:TRINITY_DN2716_c0_g1_i5.p2 TRINITY_DN2716_c0_g1~~TRINITY_DN2716_c0_g1_i5.p2  ORF type:complete len:392 (-),score=52.67 TRINITY_DN2716_c0_g1_i5:433-1608(-)
MWKWTTFLMCDDEKNTERPCVCLTRYSSSSSSCCCFQLERGGQCARRTVGKFFFFFFFFFFIQKKKKKKKKKKKTCLQFFQRTNPRVLTENNNNCCCCLNSASNKHTAVRYFFRHRTSKMLSISTSLTLTAVLLLGAVNAQFICNNYKNSEQCEGSTASDGICTWGIFGCSVAAPLPSPSPQPITAPAIVCPPYTAEVSCIYDPCQISSFCFADSSAVCVPNNCLGEHEYLGATLNVPCTAVFVDVAAEEVLNCNVKEIVRPADPDAVRPDEGALDASTKAAPNLSGAVGEAPASSVSGNTLGLPNDTPAANDTPAVATVPDTTTAPSVGLPAPNPVNTPAVGLPSLAVGDEAEDEEAVGKAPLDGDVALSALLNMDEDAPAPAPEDEPGN